MLSPKLSHAAAKAMNSKPLLTATLASRQHFQHEVVHCSTVMQIQQLAKRLAIQEPPKLKIEDVLPRRRV